MVFNLQEIIEELQCRPGTGPSIQFLGKHRLEITADVEGRMASRKVRQPGLKFLYPLE